MQTGGKHIKWGKPKWFVGTKKDWRQTKQYKAVHVEYLKWSRDKDPIAFAEKAARYSFRKTIDGRGCVSNAKTRANRRGIAFSLTHEYMMSLWPKGGIDFFGRKMVWKESQDGRSVMRLNAPSIDRIDTEKGYVPGNVMWLTNESNQRKGAMSLKEWALFLPWAIQNWRDNGDKG